MLYKLLLKFKQNQSQRQIKNHQLLTNDLVVTATNVKVVGVGDELQRILLGTIKTKVEAQLAKVNYNKMYGQFYKLVGLVTPQSIVATPKKA